MANILIDRITPTKKMEDNLCIPHQKQYQNNQIISPCRAKCKLCKQKRVHGYSNPAHVSNPFGYLYLHPTICNSCANETKRCIWCDI